MAHVGTVFGPSWVAMRDRIRDGLKACRVKILTGRHVGQLGSVTGEFHDGTAAVQVDFGPSLSLPWAEIEQIG